MSHVFSIRVDAKTIYQCYKLLEEGGVQVTNFTPAKIINHALRGAIAIMAQNRPTWDVPDEDAEIWLNRRLKVSGYDAALEATKSIFMGLAPSAPTPPLTETPSTEAHRQTSLNLADIESAIEATLVQEEIELVDSLKKGAPTVVEETVRRVIRPPWETSTLVPEKEVETDIIYTSTDVPMFKLAVRAVYSQIKKEKWGTEEAGNLVMQAFKLFKVYKED